VINVIKVRIKWVINILCPKCKSIDYERVGTETYKCKDCDIVWTCKGRYILRMPRKWR